MKTPKPLFVPALIALAFLLLPFAALFLRAPWGRMTEILAEPSVREALWLSLWTATTATAIAAILGIPLAYLLSNDRFRGVGLLRALVTVPLVLPPVVGGVALLLALGRNGVVGRYLESGLGISLPFTPAAVILAQTFVAMPFLVITVEGALRSLDDGYGQAAITLGASPLAVFARVTLPLIVPSVIAGMVLTWARALGEFGATITFAGSFPGRTQTMPIAVYNALETDPDAAIVLSLILMLVAIVILIGLRNRWLMGAKSV